jgi:transposase
MFFDNIIDTLYLTLLLYFLKLKKTKGIKMKKLAFAEKELDKYWRLFKKAPKPYVRVRALGIILVAKGYSYRKIAGFLCVRPNTVCNWVKRVRTDEEPALANKQGRGRKCKIDVEAVIDTVKQSPMKFGFDESRWTLSLLRTACPELSNMTDSGVWRLLKRIGISWKRGQHKLTSPDPGYIEKKTLSKNS